MNYHQIMCTSTKGSILTKDMNCDDHIAALGTWIRQHVKEDALRNMIRTLDQREKGARSIARQFKRRTQFKKLLLPLGESKPMKLSAIREALLCLNHEIFDDVEVKVRRPIRVAVISLEPSGALS